MTAMASRRSLFHRKGLVADQSDLRALSEFNSNCKPWIVSKGLAHQLVVFIGGLAHELAVNRGTKLLIAL